METDKRKLTTLESGRFKEKKRKKKTQGNTKKRIFWNINILLKKVSFVAALHNSILAEWIGTYLS